MDDRRLDRILGAATDLFSARGFGGTTVQDIADRANVSAGTIINYFKTKENILFILARHILESLYKQLSDISRKHEDPATALDEMLRAFANFALLDKNQLKIIFETDVFLCLDRNTFPFQDIDMSIIRCKVLLDSLMKKCVEQNATSSALANDRTIMICSLFVGIGRLLAVDRLDLTIGDGFYDMLRRCLCWK
ncbi:TetR/AcrR family transcriptional regulator [Solidesulfovibrio alcoholivorans]|uniref:TetR/AcrR family transcriptional regulator n=1 Tax=Solidesulfovibrio alcoholivorans TaxID=81406 RepID=UPI0009FD051B|nr:TetR/AcrR family transcriptional regulator [Solidesulfovibrio alcoholivorans]